jgi:ABC-2 type transport system permease protein
MKVVSCFIKTFKENLRDWKILILAIVFAPFFIYLMYMYMGDPKTSLYSVVVINNDDTGVSSGELISEWKKLKTEEGKRLLEIRLVSDSSAAKKMIKNREADLFVTIPQDFSESLRIFILTSDASMFFEKRDF